MKKCLLIATLVLMSVAANAKLVRECTTVKVPEVITESGGYVTCDDDGTSDSCTDDATAERNYDSHIAEGHNGVRILGCTLTRTEIVDKEVCRYTEVPDEETPSEPAPATDEE